MLLLPVGMTLSLSVDHLVVRTGLGRTSMLLVDQSTVVARTYPALQLVRESFTL
jgi:hypothetical protein